MVRWDSVEALRERFGKYHVLEKIAQGGMAEVYKVKTVGIAGFEKVQALKRILPHQAREGRFIRSFIDEARIAVELTHRNIVQVFDFGKADGELFLAMELIEGRDLRSAMSDGVASERLVPIDVSAYIVGEVAAGLDYAHRKTDGYGGSLGIVHCDVSPSNVMLSTDGYVKILDFGIARATFASALERRRLRGKPRYMAPEQTLGEPPTAAADVFALGIIAWELFTGLPLYRGPDLKAILEAVRKTTPPRIDRMNPAVPHEIVEAVEVALARDPAARGSAADLAQACARTALLGGSRVLSRWLAELETRPAVSVWQADQTSISVPRPSGPDLGEGTPGPHSASEIGFIHDAPPTTDAFERADLPLDEVTRDGAAASLQFDAQASLSNAARVDAIASTPEPIDNAMTPPSALPIVRRSYAMLDPGMSGSRLPQVHDVTHDDLLPEPPHADDPGDEAIDDDLGASATVVPAERRRTVLVAGHLEGAAHDVLRPIAKSLGELAYQRGGVVVMAGDDTLLVAFGLEVAGEDDVAIAMGWALDASAMLRDLREAADDAIVLRLGARAGVTSQGAAVRLPQDAIDEAHALAREAQPDRPLFVGTAGRLTSGLYSLREVPTPRRVARRSRVIEVIGPRGFDERDRMRLERRGRFVGRVQQLAELDAWMTRAIAADRRLAVLVTGVAGTGKSRLMAELVARRTAAGAALRVVTTAASPASRLAPFALVIDLYQAALGLPPARGRTARAQVGERLLHLLSRGGPPTARARAVVSDLDRAMELRDGLGLGAPEVADLRPRISAGLAAFRLALIENDGFAGARSDAQRRGAEITRARPALTVIEDIHLADGPSLEVLRHTMAVTANGAELLVLTARPDAAPTPPVDLVLTVGDLVGAELRALITDRLGDAATPQNIAAVIARGGGNPLFIEELSRAVREASPTGAAVPASARDVVAARVDRLSVKARNALRFAAVLGETVRARLLEELLDEETLAGELDELVAAGFVVRTAGSSSEGELALSRGLVREVVYEALSARAQRDSHARIGRLLASRFFAGRDEPPAVIAEHLERGGEPKGAAAFWLRAGRIALAASDADGAIAHFSRTLGIERELGATPATPASRARRRTALAGREEARRLQGDLVADAGDLDELERLCEGSPARLADVATRRAQRALRSGDYAAAQAATVRAEQYAMSAGDDRLHGEALRVRGEILERLGRFDEALDVVGMARELFHRRGAVTEEMAAIVGAGRIHLLRAHYEAARDAYRPVLALIAKTGDPWLERIVTNHVAIIEMCLGNFTEAMVSAQRSLELCRRYGDRTREGDALSVAGIVLLEVGMYDAAAALFADALDNLGRTGSRWSRADCLIYAGACDVRRGRASGLALLDDALAEARRLGARYLEANALIARADAQLSRGAYTAAIEDAAAGTAVARAATLVGYEIQGAARHALALARLGGREAEATALADRALALLEVQRVLEGSEESVYSACAEVLAGDPARAERVRALGRASAERKLGGLVDPAWRAAYAAIPEIAALLR